MFMAFFGELDIGEGAGFVHAAGDGVGLLVTKLAFCIL